MDAEHLRQRLEHFVARQRGGAVRVEQLRSFPRLERTAAERGFESPVRRRAPRAYVPRVGVGKRP